MVAGLGKRYTIYYPDGNVEQRTMLGVPRHPGDILKLGGQKWEVVQASQILGEEIDYELHVATAEK